MKTRTSAKEKPVKVALFGYGNVGSALYDILKAQPLIEVVYVVVKQHRTRAGVGETVLTFSPEPVFDDPSIQIVVEAIDRDNDAYILAKRTLLEGKTYITANKKMVAQHLGELLNLEKIYGGSFLYEATCCGSIPIIRLLKEYYHPHALQSLVGIVNGSTNYILTKIQEEGRSYSDVLKEAQSLGYAESDPHLDVSGQDAVNKAVILSSLAFGLKSHPQQIPVLGIDRIPEAAFHLSESHALRIKLLATMLKTAKGVEVSVLPTLVPGSHPLFSLAGALNGVLVQSSLCGEQLLTGLGAGGNPTAHAMLADINQAISGRVQEGEDLRDPLSVDLSGERFVVFGSSQAAEIESANMSLSEIAEFLSADVTHWVLDAGLVKAHSAKLNSLQSSLLA